MAKKVIVGGRIESKEVGGIVTGAAEILDDSKGKKQSVINQETEAELQHLDQSKQDNLTFDNEPTEGSNNPVKSGGLYTAQQAILLAIAAINELIPSAASALNKLADMAFVNSSISTNTATFRGTSAAGLTEQQFLAWANGLEHDLNDYVFWQTSDAAGNTLFKRYKWNGTEWAYEYTLNNSTFTAEQWEAIQSGITALLVTKLRALPTAQELIQSFDGKQDVLTFDNVPTLGSTNPVKSSGIFNAIKEVSDALATFINETEALIPAEATVQNQLADKADVAAKILAAIPSWKGQYDALTDLQAVTGAKAGDIGCVKTTDSDGHAVLTFYQYSAQGAWVVYYTLRHYAQNKPATTGTTGDYPHNGMGRIELQKNIVNGVNTLTQAMLTQQNTIYVIQYDFTLGEDISIPANCVLEFDGGSISAGSGNNDTITCNNTIVRGGYIHNINCKVSGTTANEIADLFMFGAVGDGVSDDTNALKSAVAGCKSELYIPSGHFKINDKVEVTRDIHIFGDGVSSILDFSNSTGTGNDILFSKTNLTSEQNIKTVVGLPALTTGMVDIILSDASRINVGDYYLLLDNTDYSYMAARAYYKQGEFIKVVAKSGNTITLDHYIYGDYPSAHDIKLYEVNFIKVNIESFKVISREGEANSSIDSICVKFGFQSTIRNITATGTNRSHVELANCLNCVVDKVFVDYKSSLNIGQNYGVAISDSQNIVISNCILRTTRHALSIGSEGYGVNRNILVRDSIIDSYSLNEYGGDCHGNIEFITFENCQFNSGIHIGGNHTKVSGCLITNKYANYISCVSYSENSGMSHELTDNTIKVFEVRKEETTPPLTISNFGIISLYENRVFEYTDGIFVISNNIVEQEAVYAAVFAPTMLFIRNDSTVFNDIVISGNIFRPGNKATSVLNAPCIDLYCKAKSINFENNDILGACLVNLQAKGDSVVFQNNRIDNFTSLYDAGCIDFSGVSITESDEPVVLADITIKGNVLQHSQNHGVRIRYGYYNIIADGNIVTDYAGKGIIFYSNTVKNAVITNNICDQAGKADGGNFLYILDFGELIIGANKLIGTFARPYYYSPNEFSKIKYIDYPSGPTAKRPEFECSIGKMYFDTDLGKPVFLKSTDANFVSIWVDALGTTV